MFADNDNDDYNFVPDVEGMSRVVKNLLSQRAPPRPNQDQDQYKIPFQVVPGAAIINIKIKRTPKDKQMPLSKMRRSTFQRVPTAPPASADNLESPATDNKRKHQDQDQDQDQVQDQVQDQQGHALHKRLCDAPAAPAASATLDLDNIKHYSINTHKKIGCTPLVSGLDNSVKPHHLLTCKYVEKVNTDEFMAGEGQIYNTLHSQPHPNMPTIRACLRASDGKERSYVIFDPYYGDLQSYLKSNELSVFKAQAFFAQLVDAVDYCHTNNISLRDMKLGKVMFANKQQTHLVIADLTNARMLHPDVRIVYDKQGSPAYVAPEVLTQGSYDSFKADIWSLGVMLYVLVTKSYPFRDASPAALLQKITRESIDIPATVPVEAKAILLQMMNRNPAFRPSIHHIKQLPWVVRGRALAASENASTFPSAPQNHAPSVLAAAESLMRFANA
jgi:hypothetical protein